MSLVKRPTDSEPRPLLIVELWATWADGVCKCERTYDLRNPTQAEFLRQDLISYALASMSVEIRSVEIRPAGGAR